ncbi:LPS-assembly protein [Candidatus Magnetomoraceae bacterium gMMP-15]
MYQPEYHPGLKNEKLLSTVFLIILFSMIFNSTVIADTSFLSDEATSGSWYIMADKIFYDRGIYTATGNVIITKENRKLTADQVAFDRNAMQIISKGNVMLSADDDFLMGDRMEMDLEAEKGTIYNGTIFIEANHFYLHGDKIKKIGKNSYFIDKVSFTSCDNDVPDWKITGNNLKVTVEGYASMRDSVFWIKKLPVFYSPFMVLPIKLKRQTGFLMPRMEQSDRKGMSLEQPFYWAINEHSDATFYETYMSDRGLKHGLEYRYFLSQKSKGIIMYDFLRDKQIDDGTGTSGKDWGYEGDDQIRKNKNRYWFRMKHDQELPLGFAANLDLDIVSDQDYLREFKKGYSGFKQTKEYYKNFGRDVEDEDEPVRLNRLNFRKNWSSYSFNSEFKWYDDIRDQDEQETLIQSLPAMHFSGSRQKLFNMPVFLDFESQYDYFYSDSDLKGHRIHLSPRLYFPVKFKDYFYFEPSVGLAETLWYMDEFEDSDFSRTIYDIRADLSTEVSRIFSIENKAIKQIKHVIKPELVYEYIPNKDQEDYPNADSLDRIDKKNQITWSLTNTFTTKIQKNDKLKINSDKAADSSVKNSYNEVCRVKISQSYDINEERADISEKQPFSPVKGEVELKFKNISLDADLEWSVYDDEFISANLEAGFANNRGDSFFAEYRHKEDNHESFYGNVTIAVNDAIWVYGDYEYDLIDNQRIESGLGFAYKSQCWAVDFKYVAEADTNDKSYAVMIQLFN